MTGTDLCVNKPFTVPVIFEPPCITDVIELMDVTAVWLIDIVFFFSAGLWCVPSVRHTLISSC